MKKKTLNLLMHDDDTTFFLKKPKQHTPIRLFRLGLKWIALKCTSPFGQSKWTYLVHNTLEFLVPRATHTMMQSDNFQES